MVWEPMTPHPFFDEYRSHPQVAFAAWGDAPGLPERLRPSARELVPWQADGTLCFLGDGHPTPEGNALFAKAIALKALGAAGPRHGSRP